MTAMIRSIAYLSALLGVIVAISLTGYSQSNLDLETFFQKGVELNHDQIAAIRKGEPVTEALPSRTPAEVFLFGAVYIRAAPDAYLRFAHDFDRLRKRPNNMALGVFSNPPQPSDLKGFSFDDDDIETLKDCKPGNCLIQAPACSLEDHHRSIGWTAPNMNQLLRKDALQFLRAYQRDGNQALGVYNDKRNPTLVPQQFAYMLNYSKALPKRLPDFYQYLLAYPNAGLEDVEDTFYWQGSPRRPIWQALKLEHGQPLCSSSFLRIAGMS